MVRSFRGPYKLVGSWRSSQGKQVAIDISEAFDAETVERLRAVKAEYDPDGLIRASHWA